MVDAGPESITCPVCELTSHHPKDVEHGYCGNCHDYTGAPDGCVRAYLVHVEGSDNPNPVRIFKLVQQWSQERRMKEPVVEWLRRHRGAGRVGA